ncbi:MAG: DUF4442 domain-containing protein [Candidatus Thiodiazotropha sp.]
MSSETVTTPGTTPEERVVTLWRRFGNSAIGRRIYSLLFGRMVPYTGSIHPLIEEISPGRAKVTMQDRGGVRNHLNSIHAIALANLGELASGLALIAAMPKSAKGIVTHLEIDYLHKARGTLTAIGEAEVPESINEPTTFETRATIWNLDGESIATLNVHWLLSPREPK